MVLKYYYDLMSQPSRALYILLKINNISFEACPVDLMQGEHLTDIFRDNYSKFQKVPFIHDGDFKLNESIGIVRYLSREYPIKDHWYPKSSKEQARVDEFLEWQHLNIRFHCSSYFLTKKLAVVLKGREADPKKVKRLEDNMNSSLDKFEELFLSDTPFVNGQQISFADILAACEIEQPRMAGFEPRKNRPKLRAWLDNVRIECNPYYDEAHVFVNKSAEETKETIPAKL